MQQVAEMIQLKTRQRAREKGISAAARILDAWRTVPDSIVVRASKKCRISNVVDRTEDDALWGNSDRENGDGCEISSSTVVTWRLIKVPCQQRQVYKLVFFNAGIKAWGLSCNQRCLVIV